MWTVPCQAGLKEKWLPGTQQLLLWSGTETGARSVYTKSKGFLEECAISMKVWVGADEHSKAMHRVGKHIGNRKSPPRGAGVQEGFLRSEEA